MERKDSFLPVMTVIILLFVIAFFIRKLGISMGSDSITSVSTTTTIFIPTPTTVDNIQVLNPIQNSKIASPLNILGRARGMWYFEATFPIKLIDASGTEIARGVARAKDDPSDTSGQGWMSKDWVDFEAKLTFLNPHTATGTLIFMKDNPSGMPENNAQLAIPVLFSNH